MEKRGGEAAAPPCECPFKIALFTGNLLVGLVFSQVTATTMDAETYHAWTDAIKILTMACLCFIMINVGLEFDVDKSNLGQYGKDYLVAMTAAGFPWIFIALWFMFALPAPLPFGEALLAARFAAPTSAGILFSMLEAAGMKETWLFQKARVLAIFDDLDTILLMIPLKVIVVGFRWELTIDAVIVVGLLTVAWKYLHALKIDIQWQMVMVYAAAITAICEAIHVITKYIVCEMETIHLEVLMPAFVLGCVARSGHHENRHDLPHQNEESKVERLFLPPTAELGIVNQPTAEKLKPRGLKRMGSIWHEMQHKDNTEDVATIVSAVFMVLVGLSMPKLFGGCDDHEHSYFNSTASADEAHHRRLEAGFCQVEGHGCDDDAPTMTAGEIVLHVFLVSLLMIIGKMFPICCYRDEALFKQRLALSLGMCPRGEVGAGVIVISLGFGISGPAVTIAVICLAINLTLSSAFIMSVKYLANDGEAIYPEIVDKGDGKITETPIETIEIDDSDGS